MVARSWPRLYRVQASSRYSVARPGSSEGSWTMLVGLERALEVLALVAEAGDGEARLVARLLGELLVLGELEEVLDHLVVDATWRSSAA